MHEEIGRQLDRIEREHNVRVLHAVESGSRAWGFASPDSDWDVRFIYVHPRDCYLSIHDRRDVIEEMLPGDLDVSGWELRKALRLFSRSNPPLMEWLHSPIVYRSDADFMGRLLDLVPIYCSPEKCSLHYLHMALGNFREYLKGDEVWLKKYLYALRPVLACLWIERRGAWVPMEFQTLVDGVVDDAEVRSAIEGLLIQKMAAKELDRGPAIPVISQFLERELIRLEAAKAEPLPHPDAGPLNDLFRSIVDRV
jgi:predicted nucleotidyltransferase